MGKFFQFKDFQSGFALILTPDNLQLQTSAWFDGIFLHLWQSMRSSFPNQYKVLE